ncbi:MAG: class I SAM-dependent methyltransferase [Crocinitomicaceae bacterium]
MNNINKVTQVFDSCSKEYEKKYMGISLYMPSINLFCASIKKDRANIFELGCGPGNITRYLAEQHPHYSIVSTDVSSNMLKLARKNVPSVSFVEMDSRTISNLNGTFDGIMCGFVLPYLKKEEAIQLIHDAADLLEPEGILYISTMEGLYSSSELTKSSSGEHELFIHYHELEYLAQAAKEAGLFLLKTLRLESVSNGKDVIDLILIIKKQV